MHHRVVILGGGTAGITVAALLRRNGCDDVAVVDPADVHYYQPLWTLVGGGCVAVERTARPQASVMPRGVAWVRDAVVELDPDLRRVSLGSGGTITYDFLVCCPGVELDWDRVPGMTDALRLPSGSTNYSAELAPKTWRMIESFRGGSALFTAPSTPIKCPGAPQKIAYLASDHWQRTGRLHDIEVTYATGVGGLFGVPEFARVLQGVVDRYGINTHFCHELVEVDPQAREAVFEVAGDGEPIRRRIPYDLLHVAPAQRPPAFVRQSPLADPDSPLGWIRVDRSTLSHPDRPEVFALGDAAGTPNSKTGAAIRKQAPVVVANLLAAMAGSESPAHYDGYAACPFTTARGKVVMAEFDYTGRPHKTVPFIDTAAERRDMWLLKRYALPWFYWNVMLRGRDQVKGEHAPQRAPAPIRPAMSVAE